MNPTLTFKLRPSDVRDHDQQWYTVDGPFGEVLVAHGEYAGAPRFNNTRLGRCDACKAAFSWQGNRARLSDVACPRCGRALAQTQARLARYPWLRIHNDSLPKIRRAKMLHDRAFYVERLAHYESQGSSVSTYFAQDQRKKIAKIDELLAKLDAGKVSV